MSENLPAVSESNTVTGTTIDKKMDAFTGVRTTFASSFNTDSREGQIKLIDAMGSAEQLSDHLGETIMLTDYVAQVVEFIDTEGVVQEGIRLVLIDKDGNAFAAMSDGLMRSIQTYVSVMGPANTWPEPLPVKAVEAKSRRGFKFLTLKLAEAPKK